jgi:DNA-binding PadR family transcriptional regulator
MSQRIAGEILKGHMPTLVLAVVAAGPAHGYHIMKQLAERSGRVFDLGQGTVYPVLYALEEEGLLRSRTQTVGGRRRRVYSLTTAGRKNFEERAERWDVFQTAVNAVLRPSRLEACYGTL